MTSVFFKHWSLNCVKLGKNEYLSEDFQSDGLNQCQISQNLRIGQGTVSKRLNQTDIGEQSKKSSRQINRDFDMDVSNRTVSR